MQQLAQRHADEIGGERELHAFHPPAQALPDFGEGGEIHVDGERSDSCEHS
jgi:hypothetical protein